MFQPPKAARPVFQKLAPAFSERIGRRMQWLVLGAILVPGCRSLTRILVLVTGLVEGHFSSFYRLFSRPHWSCWKLGRLLAALVIELIPEDEAVVAICDTTVTEHPGDKVYGKGKHRDAVRSSHTFTAWLWGHKWVVLMLAVPIPLVSRRWALPVLVALYRPESVNQAERRRHKTPSDLARSLMRVLLAWFPQRKFILVGDGDFSSHETARFAHRHRKRLAFVGKFYADAALYSPPPPYCGHGRPRVKGDKRPSPQDLVAETKCWAARVAWYGGKKRSVGLIGGTGHWYKGGWGLVPLRWVYVEDREGTHRPEYFFSTDPKMPLKQIVEYYTLRWTIEVTFEETRAHLGLGTTRHRSKAAVERVEPWLFALFSIVTLVYVQHLRGNSPQVRSYRWYTKSEATFSDCLATVRRLTWAESVFRHPSLAKGLKKLSSKTRETLINWLTQAA